LPHWTFYLAFSLFKLAAISQANYKRALAGNAPAASLDKKKNVRVYARTACECIDGGAGFS
jgi:aminoglycoside phosphotransferase (APT) family kinase protein